MNCPISSKKGQLVTNQILGFELVSVILLTGNGTYLFSGKVQHSIGNISGDLDFVDVC